MKKSKGMNEVVNSLKGIGVTKIVDSFSGQFTEKNGNLYLHHFSQIRRNVNEMKRKLRKQVWEWVSKQTVQS